MPVASLKSQHDTSVFIISSSLPPQLATRNPQPVLPYELSPPNNHPCPSQIVHNHYMALKNHTAHIVGGAFFGLFRRVGIYRAISRPRFRASRLARKHGNYIHYQYFSSALRAIGNYYVDERNASRIDHSRPHVPDSAQPAGGERHSGKNRNTVLVDVLVANCHKPPCGRVAQLDFAA